MLASVDLDSFIYLEITTSWFFSSFEKPSKIFGEAFFYSNSLRVILLFVLLS